MLLHGKTLSHPSVAAFFTNLFYDHFHFKIICSSRSSPSKILFSSGFPYPRRSTGFDTGATAYGHTEDILKEHIDRLHAVADALIEREKISGEEFETIMHGNELAPLDVHSEDDSKPREPSEQSDAQDNGEADENEKESE